MDENKFGIRKNWLFALTYLFFPVGIVLLIENKDMSKEDKFTIVRAFVIFGAFIVLSILSGVCAAIMVTGVAGLIIGLIFGIVFWAASIALFVMWVLYIIGFFINKSLKIPFINDTFDKLVALFVK